MGKGIIQKEHLNSAISYQEFRELTDNLLAENKTTGENHSEAMLEYTRMNVQRMKRGDKTVILKEGLVKKLNNVPEKLYWVVLVEAWCGDVAQNLPAIAKMVQASDNIDLKILLRDENLDVMDQYLTNGGRSIPKLICLRASDFQELGFWGPRPMEAQQLMLDLKAQNMAYPEVSKQIHTWYAKNKNQMIQDEFYSLLDDWVL
ncbi:thioredoxin family protein [Xanthovirga aplysinae]|uniref:thioredoxin family protein n=1 Tax=Xanthovirga aplysinae TaxID=2529853 RepID=UPI0012BB6BE1|nr:thioredoxin family protein [Xanthovirga aplysinae]MTI33371.1 thioredoxin family protein [Xanthovirga aplysinae]